MKRKRFLLTMLLSAIGVLLGGSNLWAQWTSKTNLISDPSFELMTAATNLSPDAGGTYSNGIINGWSITGAWSYAQYGVANSNTTIVGIGTSFAPSAGNNYFYTRNNWNANNEYKISQTISGDLPIGYYRIKCKVASYSSSNRLQKLQLSLQEDGKTASSSDATVNNNWQEWSVRIYKESSSTSLTISASMIPGSDGGGNHYCMLLDDFQLEYLPNNYPFIIDDGIYYLYNQYNDNGSNDLHRFLARGKDNGRRAVVDPYGIPIRIINQGNDIVKMQFVDTGEYLHNTWWLYTDNDNDNSGNSSTQNLGNTFKIVESTVAGVEGYQFATQQVSPDLNAKQFMYVWLKDANTNDYYAVAGNSSSDNNVEGDFTRTVWKLLSPSERNAIVNSYPGKNAEALAGYAETIYYKPQNIPNEQTTFWLNASFTATDMTSRIGTPTFEGGTAGSWGSFNATKAGNINYSDGIVEVYQGSGTWSQTISGLAEGIYKVTVNAFERHGSFNQEKTWQQEYGNIGSAYLAANGQQTHLASWNEFYTGDSDPNNRTQAAAKFNKGNYLNEVYAYVGSDGNLTINVTIPGYLNTVWLPMNNFTLTYYEPSSKKTPVQPTGTYYLRNKATGEYITFDGYWGTYYSMSDAGKQLTLKSSDDGTTLMHTTYLSNTDDVTSSKDTENYFYSYKGRPMHAYSNGNNTEGGEKWVFYEVSPGIYNIMNYMTGYYLSGDEGYDNNSTQGWGGLLKTTAAPNDQKVQWELVTKEALTLALTASGASYPQNASFLIDEPDLIAGFNNVYKEFYSWKVMGSDQTKYSDWNTDNITTFYFDNTNGTSEGNSTYAYCAASDYPDILQTITGIPNGLYVVECQAVFRDGNSGNDTGNENSSSRTNWARLQDKTYVNRAYLYANDNLGSEPTDARDKRDRFWIYENAQLMPVRIATDQNFAANDDLLSAIKGNQYTVQLPIYVNNGKLTIGVLQEIGINDNLLVFDRFRLTYYGENYSGDEVRNIAKANLQRLKDDYNNYQSNTITTPEYNKLDAAITDITSESNYNTNSETVAQYNKVAQNYGETSISWYIFNVLKTDYDNGQYTTVAKDNNRAVVYENNKFIIRYPYVDEESKKNVVKYFGPGSNTNNAVSYYNTSITYTADTQITALNDNNATLENLKAAISALRTYVEANAEARYIEDEEVEIAGASYTSEQRIEAREARMALVTGSAEAIITDDGKKPAYDTNPLMFTNAGAEITAPDLNKVVKNARCWAPRDAYGHRFYDYTNYYGAGPYEYEIEIDGLITGKYLVTISESHNNQLHSVLFNAYVGEEQIVENEQLFQDDGSVWQSYTHSWQDVSCVVDIDDTKQFQTIRLTFTGGGNGAAYNATMNICNLRIYRMEGIEMLLLDDEDTRLAKHKNYENIKTLLKREMATNQWNTLVLPVNLTKQQVMAGFGEGTILATMDGFSQDYGQPDNCIHFTTDDLSGLADTDTAIEEGKVYLIKPTAEPAVGKGETATYKNADEGQSTYTEIPGPVYYLDYVNYTRTIVNEQTEPEISHASPNGNAANAAIDATGAQTGKLTLQMQGSYEKTVVPVNATAENGGTNYIYAFQQQEDNNVYLVELDPSKSNTYTQEKNGIDGEGRLFKGYRGWVVANYKEGASVRQSYTVLLDEGDDQLTIVRGIDSQDDYSEVKISRQGVYDLQGRSIDRKEFYSGSYPQGVYIVDGKKVVRK